MVSWLRYQTGSKRIYKGLWPPTTSHCPLPLAISTARSNACALFMLS